MDMLYKYLGLTKNSKNRQIDRERQRQNQEKVVNTNAKPQAER
jgi:hypothetical protein